MHGALRGSGKTPVTRLVMLAVRVLELLTSLLAKLRLCKVILQRSQHGLDERLAGLHLVGLASQTVIKPTQRSGRASESEDQMRGKLISNVFDSPSFKNNRRRCPCVEQQGPRR